MTTYSTVLPTFSATTAGLKDAMNSVSTLMTNAGWALAADTGQMDITAVTYNALSGTLYGYKIWYLNDSQHSTYPIYMRMYWRMAAANSLGIGYTIGHATDGAGNITGYKNGSDTTYLFSGLVGAWGTAANASKAVTVEGFSWWTLAPATVFGNCAWMYLSREWDDTTGAVKAGGNYTLCWVNSTTAPQWICVNRTASTTIAHGYAAFTPASLTASMSPGTTDVFRHYAVYTSATIVGGAVSYHSAEATQWGTFSAQPLTGGSARTFIATAVPRFTNGTNSSSTDCLAVIWE